MTAYERDGNVIYPEAWPTGETDPEQEGSQFDIASIRRRLADIAVERALLESEDMRLRFHLRLKQSELERKESDE